MKITTKVLCAFLMLPLLLSCSKENGIEPYDPQSIIGYWVDLQIQDTVWTFKRAHRLKDGEHGIAFKPDRELIERKNAGWCGTPPVSYADFEGTWHQNDSLIDISVGYWGGTSNYQWRIISIDNNTLKVYRKE